jgi:hypothetical protein
MIRMDYLLPIAAQMVTRIILPIWRKMERHTQSDAENSIKYGTRKIDTRRGQGVITPTNYFGKKVILAKINFLL